MIPPELALEIGRLFILSVRYRRAIARWTKKNRPSLLAKEERTFFKGPFFWKCGEDANVYRITARDEAGVTREGFVKVESSSIRKTPEIDVRWDEEPSRS